VANGELLRRIDAHMERGNELMEQNRRAFEETRVFMRQLLLRNDKVLGAMQRQIEASTRAIRKLTEDMHREHLEFVEEMRAQRAALFRILDRLDGNGDPAGA
jgi:hypothetical protein